MGKKSKIMKAREVEVRRKSLVYLVCVVDNGRVSWKVGGWIGLFYLHPQVYSNRPGIIEDVSSYQRTWTQLSNESEKPEKHNSPEGVGGGIRPV